LAQFIRAAGVVALVCATTPAAAGASRVFVSAAGADSAACGAVASPCRTLQYVHDNIVSPGGEIDLMGAGEYGPITVRKAISIVNKSPGVASLTQSAAGRSAILVAAAANDVVHLEGLSMDGGWSAANGIYFQAGATLTVRDCVIRHFKDIGLRAQPGSAATLLVDRLAISEVGNDGVRTDAAGGGLTAYLDGLKIWNVATGFVTTGGVMRGPQGPVVKISNSVITGTRNAFVASSDTIANPASLTLDRIRATGNGAGLVATNANIRLSRSVIVGNGVGVSNTGGSIKTNKNNMIGDNGQNVVGTGLVAEAQN
jgi:hypothetical protein